MGSGAKSLELDLGVGLCRTLLDFVLVGLDFRAVCGMESDMAFERCWMIIIVI